MLSLSNKRIKVIGMVTLKRNILHTHIHDVKSLLYTNSFVTIMEIRRYAIAYLRSDFVWIYVHKVSGLLCFCSFVSHIHILNTCLSTFLK